MRHLEVFLQKAQAAMERNFPGELQVDGCAIVCVDVGWMERPKPQDGGYEGDEVRTIRVSKNNLKRKLRRGERVVLAGRQWSVGGVSEAEWEGAWVIELH